ncbi:AMP-dependent synthetase/ligase [Agrococcus carbonis]|uniref:Acyl-CoA synthetase n=1 Tax=Agrococcus carbonis TaxID=684552 RepID=A0A1H1SVX5_9MICO|nr:AMP-dependent synthetase/ligase [Agrococcus carbonis]SDS52135.1 long-chain acyl-CoA synthetase [Agrococcus carbonis]
MPELTAPEGVVPPVVAADPQANITDLLEDTVRQYPDAPLFAVPDGEGWRDISSTEFRRQVVALAKGFVAAGVQPGDFVGFMCKVRYEFSLVDFALFYAGARMVPVYETSAPSQIQWILSDSGATRVILEDAELVSRFDEAHGDLPAVTDVWRIDRGDLDRLVEQGKDVADDEIERRRALADGADLATLIYTSGSTGRPKGTMLTHANFVELCRNAKTALAEVVGPGSSTLLFVTQAHVFARFISVLGVAAAVRVGHQSDTKKLLPSMGSFKPTFFLAVPRVFEKVYNASEQKAEAGGKGKIFRAAAHAAVAHSKALDAGHVPLGLKLRFAVLDALVLKKLRTALGGNVKYAVSGSAPLGTFLAHFYRSLGIRILEGYGLTETTAPVTVNLPDKFKIGTVGPALPGNGVRIAEDGEVLAKGVCVFDGYWKNEQATAEAFTEDGWFRTGDIGALDADGYLTITGRKKELIVTAGGKNVAPNTLEDPIRANTIVGQPVVVGDQRKFVAALITLDSEMLATWLANNGHDGSMSLEEAAAHPAVIEEVRSAIQRANKQVSRAESVRKFAILPIEFIEANGHLTPKMSIKRHNILQDFAAQIDDIYASNSTAHDVD